MIFPSLARIHHASALFPSSSAYTRSSQKACSKSSRSPSSAQLATHASLCYANSPLTVDEIVVTYVVYTLVDEVINSNMELLMTIANVVFGDFILVEEVGVLLLTYVHFLLRSVVNILAVDLIPKALLTRVVF